MKWSDKKFPLGKPSLCCYVTPEFGCYDEDCDYRRCLQCGDYLMEHTSFMQSHSNMLYDDHAAYSKCEGMVSRWTNRGKTNRGKRKRS